MKKLAVIYNPFYLHVNTIKDHVEGFSKFQEFDTYYVPVNKISRRDLDNFDGVIIHYAIRLAFPETLPKDFISNLSKYRGMKYIFIQDEYDNTEKVRAIFEEIKPSIVFTCVPNVSLEYVYPTRRFPETRFINVLTGFAPSNVPIKIKPLRERPIDVGYRGRRIGNRYGQLGFDKWRIGDEFKRHLQEFPDLSTDISSLEEDRIYGDEWYEFLGNCKAVLGTESGSNVFDWDGSLRRIQDDHPYMKFEVFYEKYLANREIDGLMNQISPRIFEAAATGTALILFEGSYSGLLEPWKEYIPLRKDFSNFHQVVRTLTEPGVLEAISTQAFRKLIATGQYSQEVYFKKISNILSETLGDSKFNAVGIPRFDKIAKAEDFQLPVLVDYSSKKFFGYFVFRFFWRLIPFNFRISIIGKVNVILNRASFKSYD